MGRRALTAENLDPSTLVEMSDSFTGSERPGVQFDIKLPDRRGLYPAQERFGGYIYCLEVSGDIFKVGATVQPKNRIATHCSAARAFGLTPLKVWFSPAHREYLESESLLIAHLAKQCDALGPESFRGAATRELVQPWWKSRRVLPPGEFPFEQHYRRERDRELDALLSR